VDSCFFLIIVCGNYTNVEKSTLEYFHKLAGREYMITGSTGPTPPQPLDYKEYANLYQYTDIVKFQLVASLAYRDSTILSDSVLGGQICPLRFYCIVIYRDSILSQIQTIINLKFIYRTGILWGISAPLYLLSREVHTYNISHDAYSRVWTEPEHV
jgi:hypothetical protein